jgi:magnesium-transporting ATPase (P-type)
VFEISFDSWNKYFLSVHDTSLIDNNPDFLVTVKGAPERIISFCSEILVDSQIKYSVVDSRVEEMNRHWQRRIDECCKQLGNKGII